MFLTYTLTIHKLSKLFFLSTQNYRHRLLNDNNNFSYKYGNEFDVKVRSSSVFD